jgi:prevent-host-death family protein
MEEVGIRELKQRTSDILRRVRQSREPVAITYRGRVVARLVPVEPAPREPAQAAALWVEMDELAAEISARWPAEVPAASAVAEQRR